MTNHNIPALSLAITKDDRLIHASAHGYADIAQKVLVTTAHRFRQASVSKTITAFAILYLTQQGQLNLSSTVFGENGLLASTPISRPLAPWTQNITVRHLLDHSSGFIDDEMCGIDCDPTYLPQWLHLDQWDLVTTILEAYDPGHAPGSVASYSNFGYFVLGRIVEVASGVMPYAAYVTEILDTLLGITAIEGATDEIKAAEVMYYHDGDDGAPYAFAVERRDSVGAWIARPVDLVMLLTGIDGLSGRGRRSNVLDVETRNSMFEQSAVPGSGFGLGWDEVVYTDEGNVARVSKNGGYAGTHSWVSIDFERNVSYAVAVNKDIPKVAGGAKALKELIDGLVAKVDEWPEHDLFDSR